MRILHAVILIQYVILLVRTENSVLQFIGSTNSDPDDQDTAWDCTNSEQQNNGHLTKLKEMLNGIKNSDFHQLSNDNTILLLGNPGVGKTTFAQFMTDDKSNLTAKEIGTDSGYFMIEGKNIGTSVTDSFTLYPEEKLNSDSGTSFTDTPGFSDTRSETHEVAAAYAMKKYLSNVKSIKIVLLVPYHSLEISGYKDDFIHSLESLNGYIKNISEFKNSFVLVATKVQIKYKYKNSQPIQLSDEKLITDIVEYLHAVEISLKDKLIKTNDENEINFLTNALTILETLRQVDENGRHKQINLFHRPIESGSILSSPMFIKEKTSLQKTIYDNIAYSKINEYSIGYTLSYRAKTYLKCLLQFINEKIKKSSLKIFNTAQPFYVRKLNNYTDISDLNIELEQISSNLKKLQNRLKESVDYNSYLTGLTTFISSEGIITDLDVAFSELFEIREQINNIQSFVNINSILLPIIWTEEMGNVLNYFEDRYLWNNFLLKIFNRFSTYEIQKVKTQFHNDSSTITSDVDLIKTVLLNSDDTSYDEFNSSFNTLMKHKNGTDEIEKILSVTLKSKNNVTCDLGGKVTAIGYFVKLSDLQVDDLKEICEGRQLKTISVNAFHTVFIDADMDNEYFRGINLMIAAPKWEVIGSRKINLDGLFGERHEPDRADEGTVYGEFGSNGKPGLPGENGGYFMGIGTDFVNSRNLIISVNGGDGGPGQHGGFGRKGKPGNDGILKFRRDPPTEHNNFSAINYGTTTFPFFEIIPHRSAYKGDRLYIQTTEQTTRQISEEIDEIVSPVLPMQEMIVGNTCGANITIYSHHGDCGNEGGHGGHGGKGGIGGYPGKISFIKNIQKDINFVTYSSLGLSGIAGQGGIGGPKGLTGKPITCFNTTAVSYGSEEYYDHVYGYHRTRLVLRERASFWTCKEWFLTRNPVDCTKHTHIVNGTPGLVAEDITEPLKPISYDFITDILNYLNLLKQHENSRLISKSIKILQTDIYFNISKRNTYLLDILSAASNGPVHV